RTVLAEWPVLYGEWMLVTHTVAYERLPAYLVVLDLWREGDGFANAEVRNERCGAARLVVPPEIWRGVPGRVDMVEGLIGVSCWGDSPAEGVVVRRLSRGEPSRAKLVREGFARVADEAWRSGRPHNRLVEGQ